MIEIGKTLRNAAAAVGLTVITSVAAGCSNTDVKQAPPPVTGTPIPLTEKQSAEETAVAGMYKHETAVVEDEAERLALQEALVERLRDSPWSNRFDRVKVQYMNISYPGEEYSKRVATGESGNPSTKKGLMMRWLPVAGTPETEICPIMEGARFGEIKYVFVAFDKVARQQVEYLVLEIDDLYGNPYVDEAYPGGAGAIKDSGKAVANCVFLCQQEGDFIYTRQP